MPFADVNGQAIHYLDTGGKGPAILLSHGFSMDHEMWVHQVGPLTGAGWRVVTYDERGWGQTVHTEPFDYWDLAADVIGLMDHLGIDRAVLGGMSQGGFLTLRAALTAPARVRAMVLVDTDADALSDEDRTQFQALFDTAIAIGLSGEVGDALEMVLFAPGYPDARYWRGKWASKPITDWKGAKDCLFERDSILDRLGEITCPSIVFHGDADMAIPLERGRLVSELLSGSSTFVVVPGAGHTSNLEAPAVVNPAMLDFLAALD
ncbi:MAG: alpha/beta hydrolase [Acidimicrobiaceae bacterium]|nr:alpha/beta hydrolase [Acidimicrobiaceae bacterium]